MNIFEKASRETLRYSCETHGNINTEDLWNISLKALDTIAKKLNKSIKESDAEESFISTAKPKDNLVGLAFEVVKHVIQVKLEEKENYENAVNRKAQKEKLLSIRADMENADLQNKTKEEIDAMIAELG